MKYLFFDIIIRSFSPRFVTLVETGSEDETNAAATVHSKWKKGETPSSTLGPRDALHDAWRLRTLHNAQQLAPLLRRLRDTLLPSTLLRLLHDAFQPTTVLRRFCVAHHSDENLDEDVEDDDVANRAEDDGAKSE